MTRGWVYIGTFMVDRRFQLAVQNRGPHRKRPVCGNERELKSVLCGGILVNVNTQLPIQNFRVSRHLPSHTGRLRVGRRICPGLVSGKSTFGGNIPGLVPGMVVLQCPDLAPGK